MKRYALPLALTTASILAVAGIAAQAATAPDTPEPSATATRTTPADDPAPPEAQNPTVAPEAADPSEPTPTPAGGPDADAPPVEPEAQQATPESGDARTRVDVQVTLVATDVVPGAVFVSAVVPVVESDGRCTLTLSREDGSSVAIEADALVDATSTACGGLTMATGDLTPGTWNVAVGYASPDSVGNSSPTTVRVP